MEKRERRTTAFSRSAIASSADACHNGLDALACAGPLPSKPLHVLREIEPGVYQLGTLDSSLVFTTTEGINLVRLPVDAPFISGPRVWSIADQKARRFP